MQEYNVSVTLDIAHRIMFSCHPKEGGGWIFHLLVMRETGHATVLTRTKKNASERVTQLRFPELQAAVTAYIQEKRLDCAFPVQPNPERN